MKKMNISEMEKIEAGADPCSTVTGIFCGLTAILLFSTVFAPLVGATGPTCAIGIAAGCGPKK